MASNTLKTPPHTPEHNGYAQRRHKHVVETGITLLHNASLPLFVWPYAFQTASYLINQLSTLILSYKSPFECIFHIKPNYNKLHIFGCMYFPWLKLYIKNK